MDAHTAMDERLVLETCLARVEVGAGQVICDSTIPGDLGTTDTAAVVRELESNLAGLSVATVVDFVGKNTGKHSVREICGLDSGYILLSEEEIVALFVDEEGWNRLRAAYPQSGGTVTVSRVGIDERNDQALVYIRQQLDWEVGSGSYWLCSRSDGEWRAIAQHTTWMS